MAPPFVHLHLHTGYSLLTSTVRLKPLIARAKADGMPALALTDQGNLFAAVSFYTQCLYAGIKPIFGAQVYLVPDRHDHSQRPDREGRDQLLLLCRNQEGWRNLLEILSIGHLEGSHGKPRIDWEVLAPRAGGLIALSSGIKGEVGRWLAAGREAEAVAAAQRLADLFGSSGDCPNFYLELQRLGLPGQEGVNRGLVRLAHQLHLPLVASNDVHFLAPDDHRAQDALLCVGMGATLYEENRPRTSPQAYFRASAEMAELFADVPEALANTLQIAERCSVTLALGKPMLPEFALPEGEDEVSWLRRQAEEGLEVRLVREVLPPCAPEEREATAQRYRERLAFELGVIAQMGFAGYFLIVSEFIVWAKEQGIPVGPGRGSGAGSLAAWALRITDLDPIRYTLLFERFLNPERVSMPDFDVDFCQDRREEVIRHVQERYGADRVAQIITFGTLQAKAVIRDVGRVLEMPYGRVDRIAKLVPNVLGITLQEAIDQEERLAAMMAEEPEVAELLQLALALEGSPRSAGTHAAGVVIANGPLTRTVPLYRDPRSEMPVTQFNMGDAEKAGLVKFDFLGLKTLTIIQETLRLVNDERQPRGEAPIDIAAIPLDDPATYKLLQEGRTLGVFQLESSGMREILKKLAPDTFEDIVALVALYRPGPLGSGMVDDFINGKHGRIPVSYPLPQLEPVLKETYGVILYQEQVMKIAQVLAAYTLGGADLLRRAMGKKKPEEMAKQRAVFLAGARQGQIPADRAEHIFDLMEKFAGYGFNKSHSAAYALIAYQTAWLKAHHPVAFLAANMTLEMINTDKVMRFVQECRRSGIPVLPPDVNRSGVVFLPEQEGRSIRYGLAAIKNVGETAVTAVVKARAQGGPFAGLYDLCRRTGTTALNKRVLESLIKAGALDSLAGPSANRAALLEGLPAALGEGARRQEEEALGFMDLFGAEADGVAEPPLPRVAPMPTGELLACEKEALGFYITGHPLQRYEEELASYGLDTTADIRARHAGGSQATGGAYSGGESTRRWGGDGGRPKAVLAGMVVERKNHRTRKGERMAFLTLEDMHGQVEGVVFPDAFQNGKEVLEQEGPVVAEGELDLDGEVPKLMVTALHALDDYRERACRVLRLRADLLTLDEEVQGRLADLLASQGGGACRVELAVGMAEAEALLALGSAHQVHPREVLLDSLRDLLGADNASFHGSTGLRYP